MRELVLIHGRAQQDKDPVALKAEWLEALGVGLRKNGLRLPIPESAIRFPFYGDSLRDLVAGHSASDAAEIVTRGIEGDGDERRFTLEVLQELQAGAGLSDAQVAEMASHDTVDKGPLNNEWALAILRSVDRFLPHGSGAAIALFTHDVYKYLNDSTIRQQIEEGVSRAITPGVESVVVAHSLGTVVAYNLLRREGHLRGWEIPLFITLGSPLSVGPVRRKLKSFAPIQCPTCVAEWFNAMDRRDLVALFPLEPSSFPLDPPEPSIINKTDVRN